MAKINEAEAEYYNFLRVAVISFIKGVSAHHGRGIRAAHHPFGDPADVQRNGEDLQEWQAAARRGLRNDHA